MKPLQPDAGPVLRYLQCLPQKERAQVQAAVRSLLQQPDGAILLELLQKSVIERTVPITGDQRALDALNAQRFIVSDLKRLTDEHSYLTTEPKDASARAGRGG